jgi:uncharacterized membrane protein
MDKDRELWWILWGIFTAFTIQVLYDGFGLFFGQSIQFDMGLVIELVFFIILVIYTKRILKKKSENTIKKRLDDREFQLEIAETQALSDSTNSFLTTMIAVGITWIVSMFTLSLTNTLQASAIVSLLSSALYMLFLVMIIAFIFIVFNYGYIPRKWGKLRK